MKKNLKIIILVFCLCFTFFLIGVKAGAGYSSDEIYYSTTGTSVTTELNNLQKIKSQLTTLQSQGNAQASNILTNTSAVVKGILTNGTMTNYSGNTKNITSVTESGTNALFTIPNNGFYDTNSKLSIPIETIKNSISSLNNNLNAGLNSVSSLMGAVWDSTKGSGVSGNATSVVYNSSSVYGISNGVVTIKEKATYVFIVNVSSINTADGDCRGRLYINGSQVLDTGDTGNQGSIAKVYEATLNAGSTAYLNGYVRSGYGGGIKLALTIVKTN